MGEKIETAKKVRAEQAKKWEEFFDSGQPFTKEKREESARKLLRNGWKKIVRNR
jgi:hypothetical protein